MEIEELDKNNPIAARELLQHLKRSGNQKNPDGRSAIAIYLQSQIESWAEKHSIEMLSYQDIQDFYEDVTTKALEEIDEILYYHCDNLQKDPES